MLFLDLPDELLEHILILCDPIDAARVAQTCRCLRELVYEAPGDSLWRGLYLTQLELDDPRRCVAMDGRSRSPIRWKQELQRAVRARTLVTTNSIGRPGELGTVLQTLLDLATCVRPITGYDAIGIPDSFSRSLVALPALLRYGWIDLVERLETLAEHERQLVARFHTYYGLTQNDVRKEARVKARAFVYNFRNYTPGNEYGPFFEDGRVNWVHVRAMHEVMSMQLVEQQETDAERFEYAVYPMSLPFTQIVAMEEEDGHDWLGIVGEWEVSFSFCDHRVLLRYNETITQPGIPKDTSIFEDDDMEEVFRVMRVEMQLLKMEPDPQHPDFPVVYFAGQMKDFASSLMNGKAWMTSEGFVRWRFISGEQNDPIWSSEGVQIGGLRSSYGVLGAWTTIFHDADDPVGPFWMRKADGRKVNT